MKENFKVGILGTGKIARNMARVLCELDGVEAYAVASRTLEKAEGFANEWGIRKAYGSYEELAKDSEVRLVYVASPHSEHYANALLCLENGKNVLVEKAFTANASQAKALIELARERKLFLAEAMWTRYMPSVQMIKDIIKEGKIGEIDSIDAEFSVMISHIKRMHEPALAGGALLDLGVYPLTFASMFLGDDVICTRSRCMKFVTGVDATDHIELTYKTGQQAFLRTSMVSGPRNEGTINGTKGYIHVSNLNNIEKIQVYDENGQIVETIVSPRLINGFEYEVLACKEAIEKGELECAYMPLDQTLLIMEQMDELRRAWGVKYPFE